MLKENYQKLGEATEQLTNVIKGLENGTITIVHYEGEIDTEVVEKYRSRFLMFAEDGVGQCINDYLAKAQTENVNDATKMKINLVALNIIAGGNGNV